MTFDRLETDRLILRQWQDSDREPFAVMSADPESMQYLGGTWPPEAADNYIERCKQHFNTYGYGTYATELKATGEFMGFVALKNMTIETPFTPAVEIGWRIARPHWGKGYATEGAQKLLHLAFNDLGLDRIFSYCCLPHTASRKVMEKIGMTQEPDTFLHPAMDANDPLAEMITYSIRHDRRP